MDPLEELISQIQRCSSGSAEDVDKTFRHLKVAEDKGLLSQSASRIGSVLDRIDPSQHSLAYLFLLEAYTAPKASKEQARGRVSTIARFIDSCVADQIRLVPDKFVSVCRRFKDEILLLKTPMRGVAPLRIAIHKLQSSSGKLTTLHPDFLMLCLLAKCYKTGYSILEEDIFEMEHPKDLFLYLYYGGLICIGLKSYRKAIELLYSVVTAPKAASNAIAIEAHKKYILVSLIHSGKFLNNIPKHAQIVQSRNAKSLCQHYYDLGEVYCTGSVSELESFLELNKDKFQSENNLGLAKQVVSSLYKRNIQKLTQAYLTLSLQDIANRVQLNTPKEAEIHVLQMIQDGEIFATINQKDGMVNFHEDPEQYKTCEVMEQIDMSIQRMLALSKKFNAVDENMSCDPAYLGKAKREQRNRYDYDDFDPTQDFFM
ncbi:hypothetical protein ACHQM5_007987 [Ranunculus cassubicifolius]